MLLTGLIVLWRKGVPAYITAFKWQSGLPPGRPAIVRYGGREPQLYGIAVLLLLVKGVALPLLLSAAERRFGTQRELLSYVNTEISLLIGGMVVLFGTLVAR